MEDLGAAAAATTTATTTTHKRARVLPNTHARAHTHAYAHALEDLGAAALGRHVQLLADVGALGNEMQDVVGEVLGVRRRKAHAHLRIHRGHAVQQLREAHPLAVAALEPGLARVTMKCCVDVEWPGR